GPCVIRVRSPHHRVNFDRDETTRMVYFSYATSLCGSPTVEDPPVSGRSAPHRSTLCAVSRELLRSRERSFSTVHPTHRPADPQRQTGLCTGKPLCLMVL